MNGVLALAIVLGVGSSALAFDPSKIFKPGDKDGVILRYGMEAYKSGRKGDAASVFRYGADKNMLAAKWKLARMHSQGDGVPKAPFAAFQLYQQIADRYATIRPNRRDLPYVANSVIALGDFFRSGIKGSPVLRDPAEAAHYYNRAAAVYGDPRAQFKLAKIYLSGELGVKQPRQAARWLQLASRKGHAASQAVLGRLFFEGRGVRRNPVRGLIMLTVAAGNAAKSQTKWINLERIRVLGKATKAERDEARQVAMKMGLPSSVSAFAPVKKPAQ